MAKDGTYNEALQLQLLAKGDEEAFSSIYTRYQQSVFAFAFYLTKSKDIAEEVVQEVFIRLWEKKEQLPEELSLLPYIKRMTQNLVLDIFRKANREQSLQQSLHEAIRLAQQEPAESLQEKELHRIWRSGIDQLPPQKKLIYTLHRDHHLNYQQIALQLGLSPNTVKNHMTEAIRSVRNYVEKNSALLTFLLISGKGL